MSGYGYGSQGNYQNSGGPPRQQYDNNGVGFFRANVQKKSQKSPDIWAYIEIDGRKYKAAGWWMPNNGDPAKPMLRINLAPATEQRRNSYNQGQGAPAGGPPPYPPRPRYDQRAEAAQENYQASQDMQKPLTQRNDFPQQQYDPDYNPGFKPPF